MLAIGTILHPTDFSPQARHAFEVACALARDSRARVVVLYVEAPLVPSVGGTAGVPPLTTEYDHERLWEQLLSVRPADPAIPVEHRLEHGDPVEVIDEVAGGVQASLIVMGTHGRRGLRRLVMGSVAEEVVRKAACPVLTVRIPTAVELAQLAVVEETPST